MRLVLRNGRVMDPETGRDEVADLWIEDGRIAGIGESPASGDGPSMDLSGKIVAPGFIDLHTHLREPGREDEETIETGTRAAARGGFTSVVCMPNTDPPLDTEASIQYVIERARAVGFSRVFPVGTISKRREGKELAEIGSLVEAGAVAISDDGSSVEDADLMRRALEYARMLGIPVAAHCEDVSLSGRGVMNEGTLSTLMGLTGSPPQAETARVAREILLAELTGGSLHIQHVSTAPSVARISEAKARGLNITAEATPHHLVLTEDSVRSYNADAKVNPPLRTAEDRAALREGLKSGVIDAIATDHAPHSLEEKAVEFDEAAFGMVGLETAVGLVLTELVRPGLIDLVDAVRLFTLGPARVLNLDLGRLQQGKRADLTILDLDEAWTVEPESFESSSKNTPFAGRSLVGRAVGAMVEGQFVMWQGEVRPCGEWISCESSERSG